MASASFDSLLQQLISSSVAVSIPQTGPELALCGTIIALLLLRTLWSADRWIAPYFTAIVGGGIAVMLAGGQLLELLQSNQPAPPVFGGLIVIDHLSCFLRVLLALFLVLVVCLTALSGIPDREDAPDFYTLLVGAVLGMMLMTSANHLLMSFLSIEMASVPSYVMVGFLKGRRQSSEAALKYVVYGAGAAGVMLYGMSLLGGLLGTFEFPQMAAALAQLLEHGGGLSSAEGRTVLLAVLMVFCGLAFKISAVPFHFWCPDAFEGATAEVAGFLSVASKAAAFGLLVRLLFSLLGLNGSPELSIALGIGIGVVATVTVTFGNLAAYSQTNLKRLLAYSTISHAGYMLMAVAALVVALGHRPAGQPDAMRTAISCVEGLLFYLVVYVFMNLGAFSVVALLRNHTWREDLDSLNGVGWNAPVLCACMALCVFSLVGLPPLGGFWGKLVIFSTLFELGSVHWFMWAMLAIGGLNTVLSLVYYIRIARAMFVSPREAGARPVSVPLQYTQYVVLVTLPVVLLGILPGLTTRFANQVAVGFLR